MGIMFRKLSVGVWKRFEATAAWLRCGVKPRVASQTILRRVGGGLEAPRRRLAGTLQACWRCFGGPWGLRGKDLWALNTISWDALQAEFGAS